MSKAEQLQLQREKKSIPDGMQFKNWNTQFE